MSHIVTCAVQMSNVPCLERAIKECGLKHLGNKTHTLWNNQRATGIGVQLPNWNHPIVIDPAKGTAVYDNFGGNWGKQIELDKLVQRYSLETAKEQAAAEGYTYEEQRLENGDVEAIMTQLVST